MLWKGKKEVGEWDNGTYNPLRSTRVTVFMMVTMMVAIMAQ